MPARRIYDSSNNVIAYVENGIKYDIYWIQIGYVEGETHYDTSWNIAGYEENGLYIETKAR